MQQEVLCPVLPTVHPGSRCFDLSHGELDMAILGQLLASTNASNMVAVESRHAEKERQSAYNVQSCW